METRPEKDFSSFLEEVNLPRKLKVWIFWEWLLLHGAVPLGFIVNLPDEYFEGSISALTVYWFLTACFEIKHLQLIRRGLAAGIMKRERTKGRERIES